MNMEKRKVCWVTGASSGIGLAVAQALVNDGHFVVISARGEQKLSEALAELHKIGSNAAAIAVDVTVAADVAAAARRIESEHGRVAVLVANAGMNIGARAWGEVSVEDFDRVTHINLNGVFYTIDAVLPGMREHSDGLVVNISSWAGRFISAKPGPAYSAAKAAVVAMTTSLNASEFRNGIRACALCPAEVATPAMLKRKIPPTDVELRRMLQPADVASAVRYVVNMPAHVCINELVISPVWNGAFGAA